MQIIKEQVNPNKLITVSEYYNPCDVIFFDIETTGLSANHSMLYIIGYNYFENGSWYIVQLFNDDGQSEPEMIEYFMQLLTEYKYIIHFNGDMFDIPYVTKRISALCTEYPLCNNFKELISIDLYKTLKPFKKTLQMDSLKQKAFEKYLGINRNDIYSGGELIQIYFSYLRKKSDDLKRLLLLHNRDDMEGMLFLSSLLSLTAVHNGDFSLTDISVSGLCSDNPDRHAEITFTVSLNHDIPRKICFKSDDINAVFDKNSGTLTLPVLIGELKYFYNDYKEYYYIPSEDTAIHKSLAEFVDRSVRTKATRATCYTRRQGYFISVPGPRSDNSYNSLPCFKSDIKSKLSYIELSDDFLGNNDLLSDYLRLMVESFL